ncbi:hypothetical protein B0T25DRAFT_47849 [Lasiosphaeria hispida]|uniref:Uncharacterized protein n=1 Tax=Lasiosphaeria hispida TaxID=260671 RepID=A0AAJ0MK97_9PEZI|nr:hypothetical protein B0T25DRAFT_47849 [Lasiosphaeria hispida]
MMPRSEFSSSLYPGGGPHEILHLNLHREYTKHVDRMGLEDAWKDYGATTFPRRQGYLGGNRGEGDSSSSPRLQPNGRSWLTLVIEAGDSSSLEDLQDDMRWWFSASDHTRLRLFSWPSWIDLEGELFWIRG